MAIAALGPTHQQECVRLLQISREMLPGGKAQEMAIARAQVHATLALVDEIAQLRSTLYSYPHKITSTVKLAPPNT